MGQLLAIATREYSKAPMELHDQIAISEGTGLAGDFRGDLKKRNVVVLPRESWEAACEELGQQLEWTIRRANLLIKGVPLGENASGRLQVGDVILEITGECDPCERMEQQVPGLFAAMASDWRGGVTCTVVRGGTVKAGDEVTLDADA